MQKLNKKEPYGVVYGHTDIAFEQDGRHFRPDGTEHEAQGQKAAEVLEQEKWSKRRE